MLVISKKVSIPDSELEMSAILSQGPGGQNVNKVSTAIHLRFDIKSSSLPEYYKSKLLLLKDRRISKDGVIIIKAQRYRSQEKNREEAIKRLHAIVKSVTFKHKKRKLKSKIGSTILAIMTLKKHETNFCHTCSWHATIFGSIVYCK